MACLLHNLAGLRHSRGQCAAGEPYIRRALHLRRNEAKGDLTGIPADLAVLGALLLGQHRLDDAEAALTQAHRLWLELHGPDHYEIAVVSHNLAAIYLEQGDQTRAQQAYSDALRIKQAVLGSDHPKSANSPIALTRHAGSQLEHAAPEPLVGSDPVG